jgi:histidinol-phosphate phosphatase family protein
MIGYSVVIPTLGRPCLADCLAALHAGTGPMPARIVLVDDRPEPADEPLPIPPGITAEVVITGGAGPASARNAGWRATVTPWVVFVDDDVRVGADWRARLADDLNGASARVAGVQARIEVPLPAGRRHTDWERVTAGLATARWITADMAYRRAALVESGGFDERFPRAFREDADLALRLLDEGWQLTVGERRTVHPVRPVSPWISVRAQAGNADDALMTAVHGPGWYERAGETKGRRPRHLAITAAVLAAMGFTAVRRPRAALAAFGLAVAGTLEFTIARIAPGPRTGREIVTMTATSVLIPPVACWYWLLGTARTRAAWRWPPPPKAILFDRDGTLIRDEPYNGDPARVRPLPGAALAIRIARAHGLRIGMITNQSGIARGMITASDAAAVNARVADLVGAFDTVQVCPHGPHDRCDCRKPAAGMVVAAAAALGVDPRECVVIGDIGIDVAAAHAAGARAVLVPTRVTLAEETIGVRTTPDILTAVHCALTENPTPIWVSNDSDTAEQSTADAVRPSPARQPR